jgi:hypothetical protein
MRKTTVYLDEEEAEALRQLAHSRGVSQAALIRDAIRQAVAKLPARRFRSLGRGIGTGGPTPRWTADDLYDDVFTSAQTPPQFREGT